MDQLQLSKKPIKEDKDSVKQTTKQVVSVFIVILMYFPI